MHLDEESEAVQAALEEMVNLLVRDETAEGAAEEDKVTEIVDQSHLEEGISFA